MNSLPRSLHYALAALALVFSTGCDQISGMFKEQAEVVQEKVQAVQKSATEAIETVQETVSGTGTAELALDQPLAATACYATLVQPGAGRPAILEIKNNRGGAEGETFPSYLFHAEAPSSTWGDLAGKDVSGQLFVRFAADGPVWFTQRDQLIQVRISTSDGQSLEAEITGGGLTSTAGTPLPAVTGKFHAVVRGIE